MLQFFRRFTKSRAGIIVSFLVLGAIAFAFAAADVSDLTPGGAVAAGDVAEVGGEGVPALELRQGVEAQVQSIRQQQPTFDIARFLSSGGLDQAVERLVDGRALWAFGASEGVVIGKRSVDGEIASIPALLGPTGQFDQNLYQSLLQQRRLTDAQVRGDIARELMGRRLTSPQLGAAQVPAQLALPYASLLLERRAGQIGFVPASAVPAGPAPTAAELQAFYGRNLARYTVPERRSVRYAVVSPEQVRAQPTEAEIAAAYTRDRARYGPSERRTIAQVVVVDQGGANALAARVRAGASIADSARAAGLEATTQAATDRAGYAALAGEAAATAAFAAAEGALIGPVRGPLGFVVARVEDVSRTAGRPLAEARPEIVAALTTSKSAEALAEAQAAIDTALTDNATFEEIVADRKLQARATPPLLATGADPENPAARPDPALSPILQAAFAVEQGDAPQLVPIGSDGGFALVALGAVVPAAPRPIGAIRDQVARDFAADRSRQAARRIAAQVVAQAGKGTPLPQALAGTGLRLPAPRPIDIARSQIAANPRGTEPALALLFSMAPGTAKLLESPGRDGWLVIKLDRVRPGDARGNQGLVNATRADIGRVVGREYVEQFVRAARNAVGVEIDRAAIGRVRAELQGQSR